VIEGTNRGRPVRPSSPLRLFLVHESRYLMSGAIALLIICGAIATFVFSRNLAYQDIVAARERVEELQTDNQRLKRQVIDQNSEVSGLEAKLAAVQAKLDEILPSKNAYNISPNQSLMVADGRLSVGFVGSPGNESITLNINGKQQVIAAGQVVDVTSGAATCQVGLQSFDLFKAVITANCPGAKPR
jgi:hypothetical protein